MLGGVKCNASCFDSLLGNCHVPDYLSHSSEYHPCNKESRNALQYIVHDLLEDLGGTGGLEGKLVKATLLKFSKTCANLHS